MKKNVKYRKMDIYIIVIIFVVLCLFITIWALFNGDNYYIKFNETIILGHTSNEIVEEYGEFNEIWNISEITEEFDSKWQGLYFYFSEEDSSGNNVNYYYIIYFDENDVAIYTKTKALPLSK